MESTTTDEIPTTHDAALLSAMFDAKTQERDLLLSYYTLISRRADHGFSEAADTLEENSGVGVTTIPSATNFHVPSQSWNAATAVAKFEGDQQLDNDEGVDSLVYLLCTDLVQAKKKK